MVSTSSVTLLGAFFSPFVNRVQIALNLKSVEFDYIEETLSSKSKLLLESNPVHGKVPVMIHDDKIICESLIIVQYIDEVWTDSGYSILPSDPCDRAVARFWAAYVDDKLIPNLKELLLAKEEEQIAVKERIDEGMVALEEVFVKCSEGKAYFGGEKIGYIDIVLGSCLEFFKAMEQISGLKMLDEARTPELAGWAERFMSNDAVKNVLPETEKFVDVLRRIQSNTFFNPGPV
ncbi:hypothetical protein DCAR_0833069 [Daucus carota subsp. sativus]|uniref:glutathione transferase n=1 Tax=Daucus carota subsp. sativus TaxID=79200 RepID=A0A175YQT6_DAUCS|nr:PREDICTED: glutathione S-transferase U17-like [Daucus carota subsp. sativus]WOH13559.1 hypothetical protein DCAR_0833069 [Daucus carota subsp. sativus]